MGKGLKSERVKEWKAKELKDGRLEVERIKGLNGQKVKEWKGERVKG